VDKIEKVAVEKMEPRADEKRKRKGLGHTAEEKCQAVLTLWTERRKAGEICRDLGVAWGVLQQWQDRAMEGMLLALQPRVSVERGVALSPRLAVLLEKKSRAGLLRGIDKRLKRLQKNIPEPLKGPEVSPAKN
jgi:transposase-like protein